MVAGKFDTAKTLALIEKLLARLQNQPSVRKKLGHVSKLVTAFVK